MDLELLHLIIRVNHQQGSRLDAALDFRIDSSRERGLDTGIECRINMRLLADNVPSHVHGGLGGGMDKLGRVSNGIAQGRVGRQVRVVERLETSVGKGRGRVVVLKREQLEIGRWIPVLGLVHDVHVGQSHMAVFDHDGNNVGVGGERHDRLVVILGNKVLEVGEGNGDGATLVLVVVLGGIVDMAETSFTKELRFLVEGRPNTAILGLTEAVPLGEFIVITCRNAEAVGMGPLAHRRRCHGEINQRLVVKGGGCEFSQMEEL